MTKTYDPARDCFTAEAPPASSDPPSPPSEKRKEPSDGASSPHPKDPAPPPARSSPPPVRSNDNRYQDASRRGGDSYRPDYRDDRHHDRDDHRNRRPSASSPSRKRKAPPSSGPSDFQRESRPRKRRHDDKFRYNTSPPNILPPPPKDLDPTPPSSRPPSPPRQRKRPGASSRLSETEKARIKAELDAREATESAAKKSEAERLKKLAAQEQVRGHYNNKRELGKQWRSTNSQIKGLRSFNNWVKSVLIQKFSPNDDFDPSRPSDDPMDHLVVLDMGCGKGGDLLKWKNAPQEVGFYLGVDTADVSIAHARDRYVQMCRDTERRRPRPGDRARVFTAEFHAMDCWTNSISKLPIASRIGVDMNVGPNANRMAARWGGQTGGFDVVSMMFCMHYAFESEEKCRQMLSNVSGALKKGGRFIGTIPSSDVISARVTNTDKNHVDQPKLPEDKPEEGIQEWGNSIYRIKFSKPPPRSGTFRPSFGWEYYFFLEEAVEEVPEYVVPWEAFRGIAEDYGLEMEYKRRFWDVWEEEKRGREMRSLAERMGVMDREGKLTVTPEEWEAIGLYLAFSFRKI